MAGPMGHGRRNMGPRPKVKNPGQTFKRLLGLILKNYKFHLITVFVCIIISVFSSVQGTLFIRNLIDDYIVPMLSQPAPDFTPLIFAILRVAAFYLVGAAATYAYSKIMIYVTQGTMRDLRCDIFRHMESLPIKYFDTHPHGDIMSVYTNDVDTLRQMVSQSMPQIFSSAITIVSVLVSMFIISVPLTLITLGMVFAMMVVTKTIGGKSSKYFLAQQVDLGKENGYIEEMMQGQKVVKVFNHEKKSIEEFNELNETLFHSSYNANMFASMLMPINGQMGNVSYVLCAIAGGVLATSVSGFFGISLGSLVSFLSFNKSFSQPITQVSQQFNSIIMALAGAERIFTLLDEPSEEDNGYVTLVNAKTVDGKLTETDERTGLWAWKHTHQATGEVDYIPLRGALVMDDVDFGYTDEKMVLHNVDIDAKPGQKIAFVGSTGAGKTTITNLINRFYDIQDGKIRYDGININKIRKSDLRRSLGIVLQETNLFSDTIMENIRYGRLDATDEEVIAAAKLANADSFIRQLPDGYNTVIKADGGNLSQGQRQMLAIARAAVADPPALILDEATSSIDTRTERMVQESMDKLMKGRTTFVIAHRLSTVRNSDCIIVLEQGRIIERGTHEQLLEQKGKYYSLYTGKAS
ncbi:ABC transporter ATP-binding protein [Lachnoclostridium sp. MSJ-17]|uniref:ABC transporter ATP-binding protein n=1 Tax=Lachnoclostridium sp. MSJ-17 TaxID=2841516 RepID=UPI001C11AB13|nr:ABC transporter ATP-binding protein [Lachnoclostridium sp. MSJ-17]MBU5461951.1 ABC transporter ATP-binding protein/permease [Lachnoclostridium sp. MSJ-17]